jgi:GNAT superfamily N-acetyltransferase
MICYKELNPDLWNDYETLFGENGACEGCWCVWWRLEKGGKLWDETKGAKAKKMMKGLIKSGKVNGILAYEGSRPVGWCSFGPRADFPHLERVKAYKRDDTEGVWCVNCFFIDREYRKQGLARGMLKASIKAMKKRKVKIIEAYPVTTTLAGKRLSPMFSYTGPLIIYTDEGFKEIQRLSPTRPLVRLEV